LIHSQIDSSVQKAHEKIDVEMNKYWFKGIASMKIGRSISVSMTVPFDIAQSFSIGILRLNLRARSISVTQTVSFDKAQSVLIDVIRFYLRAINSRFISILHNISLHNSSLQYRRKPLRITNPLSYHQTCQGSPNTFAACYIITLSYLFPLGKWKHGGKYYSGPLWAFSWSCSGLVTWMLF
jgi:hypothetical protein